MYRTKRKTSIASRLWVAAHQLWPSASTQAVFEGSGSFDLDIWRRAAAVASAADPGARMVLRGHLFFSRWKDSGITPPVRVMSARQWESSGSIGSDRIDNYSSRKGPMAEVILVEGNPKRVVFRSHHALMDGQGVITWAEDVFRALRGEPIQESLEGITENELLNFVSSNPARPAGNCFIAPTGAARGEGRGLRWLRTEITGRFPRLLPQIMLLTAREALRHARGRVRFSIPVDLRRRRRGLKSTGNLTNALSIEVFPDSTVETIAYEILRRNKQEEDGRLSLMERMVSFMPLSLMELLLLRMARQGYRTGGYPHSGIISNMGHYSPEPFQGGGFTAHSLYCSPVCLEMTPFSLCFTGMGDTVSLCLAMPCVLAGEGRIERILSQIVDGLVRHDGRRSPGADRPRERQEATRR